MIIADAMIIDHQRSMIMTWGYEHWSLWSLIMLIHAWMCCSYYDRLLIMGDDMLIIAMNRTVIIHDQRHIHVIMNIIVNPKGKGGKGGKGGEGFVSASYLLRVCFVSASHLLRVRIVSASCPPRVRFVSASCPVSCPPWLQTSPSLGSLIDPSCRKRPSYYTSQWT